MPALSVERVPSCPSDFFRVLHDYLIFPLQPNAHVKTLCAGWLSIVRPGPVHATPARCRVVWLSGIDTNGTSAPMPAHNAALIHCGGPKHNRLPWMATAPEAAVTSWTPGPQHQNRPPGQHCNVEFRGCFDIPQRLNHLAAAGRMHNRHPSTVGQTDTCTEKVGRSNCFVAMSNVQCQRGCLSVQLAHPADLRVVAAMRLGASSS